MFDYKILWNIKANVMSYICKLLYPYIMDKKDNVNSNIIKKHFIINQTK